MARTTNNFLQSGAYRQKKSDTKNPNCGNRLLLGNISKPEPAKLEFPEKLQMLFRPSRYKVLYGGRGGAKSHSVARALLVKGRNAPLRILCARELQTSIRDSVHKLLSDIVIGYNWHDFYEITDSAIRGKNGTEFFFIGLKNNISKVKSIEGVDICWVEEAHVVSKNSWEVLVPTIRKEKSEIWISFNPELDSDETYKRFVLSPPHDCLSVKIGWQDNPWFPNTLEQERMNLLARDPVSYQNVWEGACRSQVDGAIFGAGIQKAESEGRITSVPYNPMKPVNCVFDLGWSDQTAIWFFQFIGMETHFIRYIENRQQPIGFYLSQIQNFGYTIHTMYLPHDARNQMLSAGGRSIEQIVREAGYKVKVLEKMPVVESINATRMLMPTCWFDANNCADGIHCLRRYRYEVDPDTGLFSKNPLHDQYSHGGDSFRYAFQAIENNPKDKKKQRIHDNLIDWQSV